MVVQPGPMGLDPMQRLDCRGLSYLHHHRGEALVEVGDTMDKIPTITASNVRCMAQKVKLLEWVVRRLCENCWHLGSLRLEVGAGLVGLEWIYLRC